MAHQVRLLMHCCVMLGVWLASHDAWATAFYTNLVSGTGYNNSAFQSVPWTAFHPGGAGYASSQGVSALEGNGAGSAVHVRADASPGIGRTSDAMLDIEFMLERPLFANIPVTIAGEYHLEVFGRGSAQIDGFVCRGFVNQCQVNQTILANLPFDRILSNLSPTNEARRVPYFVNTVLPANTWMTLKLHALAGIHEGQFARAFLDPIISFDDALTTITFGSGAIGENLNFVPPPSEVPAPASSVLALVGCACFGASRRSWRGA